MGTVMALLGSRNSPEAKFILGILFLGFGILGFLVIIYEDFKKIDEMMSLIQVDERLSTAEATRRYLEAIRPMLKSELLIYIKSFATALAGLALLLAT